ncbi:hypothetical protein RRG08_050581 [Elysia crispata]|uniref:Uncharacterized protein n=1 Tax=Elysia crispata TaxID=231223 RepID=A0AAE1DAW0_9GAST|nr:hypothetical protein RRG08_050581 [Elysia crispata]
MHEPKNSERTLLIPISGDVITGRGRLSLSICLSKVYGRNGNSLSALAHRVTDRQWDYHHHPSCEPPSRLPLDLVPGGASWPGQRRDDTIVCLAAARRSHTLRGFRDCHHQISSLCPVA